MSTSAKEVASLKCIVIGSSGVGKTSLTKRLVENTFDEVQQSTVGVEFEFTTIYIDGEPVKLNVWDTAGQEKFRSISRAYFRAAVCVLLVFDVTNKASFGDLNSWLKDIHTLCDPNASVILVGNKCDLATKRVVSTAEGQQYADERKLKYIETSAASGVNVSEAFVRSAADVYKKSSSVATDHVIKMHERNITPTGSCC